MRRMLHNGHRVGIRLGSATIVVVISCSAVLAQAGGGLLAGFPNPAEVQPAAKVKTIALDAQIQSGRELFMRRWKQADATTPTGDGLGPVYNARSCAECHSKVRPGGAGDNDHNVDLLTVITPNVKRDDRAKFVARIAAIDAALSGGGNSLKAAVTLHKFGTDPRYGEWRLGVLELIGGRESDIVASKTVSQLLAAQGKNNNSAGSKRIRKADLLQLGLAQRSTPALFGAGFIDQISDDALREIALAQAKRHDSIKGKVATTNDCRTGKFGWRGQTATLQEFVMGACANELGLQVPGHDQGIDPLNPDARAKGLDLTQQQCDDLTAFIVTLPRPEQRKPITGKERKLWDAGEQVFNSVGCANCHVRTLDHVDGLYSDLLLHDLGPKLADPAGATPPATSSPSGYNGGQADVFVQVPPITRRQWRTTPLWGVADSAPYLHDGRAATLKDAIAAHAGEALAAAKMYAALPAVERDELLAFLNSLAAPASHALVAQK